MTAENRPSQSLDNPSIIWETPSQSDIRRGERTYWGTLVLDVDGTLTVPGHDYRVDLDALSVSAKFLGGGGNLDFCTGATRGRLERTLLTPFYNLLSGSNDAVNINKMFRRVVLQPENGSALLLFAGSNVVENEVVFDWHRLHELHVPNKEELKELLKNQVLPSYTGSYMIADDYDDFKLRRDYMISVKGIGDPRRFKRAVEEEIAKGHPEIDWDNIAIKAARTTVDFVHKKSGKAVSVPWLLREVAGFTGPVIGFGDLGDEFACVVPTFNCNQKDPNAFRSRSQPAIDLTGGWELLNDEDYVIVGEGPNTKVLHKKSGKEIPVLRIEEGQIVYAKKLQKDETEYLVPTSINKGHPVRIKSLTYQKDGQTYEVEDAGKGMAYMVNRLMDLGYFS